MDLDEQVARAMGFSASYRKHGYVELSNENGEIIHTEHQHCEHEASADVEARAWQNGVDLYLSVDDGVALLRMLSRAAAKGLQPGIGYRDDGRWNATLWISAAPIECAADTPPLALAQAIVKTLDEGR